LLDISINETTPLQESLAENKFLSSYDKNKKEAALLSIHMICMTKHFHA